MCHPCYTAEVTIMIAAVNAEDGGGGEEEEDGDFRRELGAAGKEVGENEVDESGSFLEESLKRISKNPDETPTMQVLVSAVMKILKMMDKPGVRNSEPREQRRHDGKHTSVPMRRWETTETRTPEDREAEGERGREKEAKEEEKRKTNLVIREIPEGNLDERDAEKRTEVHKKNAREVFKMAGLGKEVIEIEECRRLGPYDPNNADQKRPLLIVLKTEEQKNLILEAKTALKDSIGGKHVYIDVDMTPGQRKRKQEKRKMADVRNEEEQRKEPGTMRTWIVTGTPAEPRMRLIIRKRRSLSSERYQGEELGRPEGGD